MNNYYKIWESINSESKNNPFLSQIARRIPSINTLPVFLATDYQKGVRMLYIKIDSDNQVPIDSLPHFRGLEISLIQTSIGEFRNQEFLKFTQILPNTDNMFESVISDICDKVVNIKNKDNLTLVLTKALNEWRLFFEKNQDIILSVSRQKGLIAELYFLRHILFQKYSYSDAINFWTGSERTNHDFQINDLAIEVKATSSKQHKKFTVSSEKQLDATGLSHLYLVLFSLNLHSEMPARSLSAFIDEICYLIQDDPLAKFYFELKLFKYGYKRKHSSKYLIGFSFNDIKLFEVRDNFPCLLNKNLPSGVGDLKYTIAVSACTPFELDIDLVKIL